MIRQVRKKITNNKICLNVFMNFIKISSAEERALLDASPGSANAAMTAPRRPHLHLPGRVPGARAH